MNKKILCKNITVTSILLSVILIIGINLFTSKIIDYKQFENDYTYSIPLRTDGNDFIVLENGNKNIKNRKYNTKIELMRIDPADSDIYLLYYLNNEFIDMNNGEEFIFNYKKGLFSENRDGMVGNWNYVLLKGDDVDIVSFDIKYSMYSIDYANLLKQILIVIFIIYLIVLNYIKSDNKFKKFLNYVYEKLLNSVLWLYSGLMNCISNISMDSKLKTSLFYIIITMILGIFFYLSFIMYNVTDIHSNTYNINVSSKDNSMNIINKIDYFSKYRGSINLMDISPLDANIYLNLIIGKDTHKVFKFNSTSTKYRLNVIDDDFDYKDKEWKFTLTKEEDDGIYNVNALVNVKYYKINEIFIPIYIICLIISIVLIKLITSETDNKIRNLIFKLYDKIKK